MVYYDLRSAQVICETCHGKGVFQNYFPCTECNGSGISSCCDTAGENGMWDTSEDKLVNDVALMFFDAMAVKSDSSSYAKTVIKMVRDHDKEKRK
jgi:RecJ-like exonuclease